MTGTLVEESSSTGTAWANAEIPAAAAPECKSLDSIHLPTPLRSAQLRRDLRCSVSDAAYSGVMVGTGETYLPAFVLAAGLGDVVAGLVASVPQLAGGIAQLISPRGVRILQSHRRWVTTCAAIQALSFLPLIAAALYGGVSAVLALSVATLYWSAGLASGPPWNAWMGTIVPRTIRPRYFACRTRFQQAAVLAGFLLSGAAIQFGATASNALAGFAILFALAVGCRLVAATYLARTSEREPMPGNIQTLRLPALVKRYCRGAEAQRLLYISLVQGAAYFASPYCAPYMLRVLNLSYFEYVVLISTAYAAKVASVSIFGNVAARFGVRRLLWVGGVGIVPVAGAWILSDNFWFLIVVQLGAGTAWAAYELAVFLICFNSIRAEERTSVLTLFNLSTTAAMVAGSLLGGAVLIVFGPTRFIYHVLFGGSSLLRLGTLFFLRRIPTRLIEKEPGRKKIRPIAPTLDFRPHLTGVSNVNATAEWIDTAAEPVRRAG